MFFTLAVVNVFLAAATVGYWRTQRVYPGFGLWTLCRVAIAAAYVFYTLRGLAPDALTIVAANELVVLATLFRLEGIRRFLGAARISRTSIALAIANLVFLTALLYLFDSSEWRFAAVISTVAATDIVGIYLLATRGRASYRPLTVFVGILAAVNTVIAIGRMVQWFLEPSGATLLAPTVGNIAYYLLLIVIDIAWAGVFISLNNQRATDDLAAARAEVDHARDRLELTLALLPDPTFVVDGEGRLIAWNRAMEEMTGAKAAEVIGKDAYELSPVFFGEHRRVLAHVALGIGREPTSAYSRVERDGDVLTAELDDVSFRGSKRSLWAKAAVLRDPSGQVTGAIESFRDTTERRRMEEERVRVERRLVESERLESLGLLAGGIAHKFNNLLLVVQGNLELLEPDLGANPASREQVSAALGATAEATELTRQIVAYAGRTLLTLRPLHVNDLITEHLDSFARAGGGRLSLELGASDVLPRVSGDAEHLRRAITSLLINAAEALDGTDGSVKLSTTAREGCVVITVKDEGPGMDPEVLEHVFDPFFSTKFLGRGLGLSAARGIVKEHGGEMLVESEPGRGTTVSVFLPAAAPATPV